jgi:enoyl-CoA hydratase/carnithine racemase
MIYGQVRLPARRLYEMGQVNRIYPDLATMQAEALAFARHAAEQNPAAIRQAKRAADITMDIQGQHYVVSRMAELLDEFPVFELGTR